MSATTKGVRGKKDTYLDLIVRRPLKSIATDAELSAAQEMIDELLALDPLDEGSEQYLDALSDLVAIYEDKHWKIEPSNPRDLLAFLIESSGRTQAEVADGAGVPRSTVSAVLNGKRVINLNIAQHLSKFFNVPVSVFVNDRNE